MPIKLGKYSFTGPIKSIDKLKDRSGIYAVICKVDKEFFLIDIGESSKLKTRIENYDKKECWKKNCNGQIEIFVHYTIFLKQRDRIIIEQELRELFHPECKMDEKIGFTEFLF